MLYKRTLRLSPTVRPSSRSCFDCRTVHTGIHEQTLNMSQGLPNAEFCVRVVPGIEVPTPAAKGSSVTADWTSLSGVMQELQSNWSDCSAIPERCRPLVCLLKAPEKGLPVINGIEAWLNAVDHWTEAACFLHVPIDFVGLPLLASIDYNQHLYQMSPRMFHARQQDLLILHNYSHAQDGITEDPLLGLTKYWTPEASFVWSADEVLNTQPGDFDLFMVVPSVTEEGHSRAEHLRKSQADKMILQTLAALKDGTQCDCSAVFTSSYVTWLLDQDHEDKVDPEYKRVLKVQIICRLYESPAQVVHGFDVDASAMLFYNGDVWATDRALRALHHGFLLVDPLRQSPGHIHRLLKYAHRYGLAMVDPAMDPRLILRSHSYIPSMLAALHAEGNSGIAQWQGWQSCCCYTVMHLAVPASHSTCQATIRG